MDTSEQELLFTGSQKEAVIHLDEDDVGLVTVSRPAVEVKLNKVSPPPSVQSEAEMIYKRATDKGLVSAALSDAITQSAFSFFASSSSLSVKDELLGRLFKDDLPDIPVPENKSYRQRWDEFTSETKRLFVYVTYTWLDSTVPLSEIVRKLAITFSLSEELTLTIVMGTFPEMVSTQGADLRRSVPQLRPGKVLGTIAKLVPDYKSNLVSVAKSDNSSCFIPAISIGERESLTYCTWRYFLALHKKGVLDYLGYQGVDEMVKMVDLERRTVSPRMVLVRPREMLVAYSLIRGGKAPPKLLWGYVDFPSSLKKSKLARVATIGKMFAAPPLLFSAEYAAPGNATLRDVVLTTPHVDLAGSARVYRLVPHPFSPEHPSRYVVFECRFNTPSSKVLMATLQEFISSGKRVSLKCDPAVAELGITAHFFLDGNALIVVAMNTRTFDVVTDVGLNPYCLPVMMVSAEAALDVRRSIAPVMIIPLTILGVLYRSVLRMKGNAAFVEAHLSDDHLFLDKTFSSYRMYLAVQLYYALDDNNRDNGVLQALLVSLLAKGSSRVKPAEFVRSEFGGLPRPGFLAISMSHFYVMTVLRLYLSTRRIFILPTMRIASFEDLKSATTTFEWLKRLFMDPLNIAGFMSVMTDPSSWGVTVSSGYSTTLD